MMNNSTYLRGALAVAMGLSGPVAQAQTAALTSYAQFNDSLVAQYNRLDFKAIEAYGSAAFRQMEPAGNLARYLAGLRPQTGRIGATVALGAHGKSHEFEWRGEKQNLRVGLVAPAPGVLDDYFISDFIAQTQARPTPAPTDNPRQSPLDLAVHRVATLYLQHPEAVGLSVGVYWQGRPYVYNYGEVEQGRGHLPTATTYYDMGSIAKTFVTTLLAQAVTEKKVQLTDDIRRYLPGEYPNLAYQGHPVRLVDLANHTSGLPTSSHTYPQPLQDSLRGLALPRRIAYYNQYSADSLLRDMHHFQLITQPGTVYKYNGNALKVLQLLLERIYQQPYEQLVTTYVRTHFGMAATKRVLSAAEQQRFAVGYDEKHRPQPHPNYVGYWGGPNLSTTPLDMLKYAQANLAAREPAVRLAQQRTWGAAPHFGLGLGWMLDTDADGNHLVYHDGHAPGFNARCVLYPEQGLGMVVLVNDNISQNRLIELTRLLQQALPATERAKSRR